MVLLGRAIIVDAVLLEQHTVTFSQLLRIFADLSVAILALRSASILAVTYVFLAWFMMLVLKVTTVA